MKCALKTDKGSCEANAMKKSQYCFTHEPTMKERHLAAASKGGQLSRGIKGVRLEELAIDSPKGVCYVLADALNRIRIVKEDGAMELNTASTIGYLCSQLIRSLEVANLEERITEIEKTVFKKL